jgi:hypothetical protein
MARRRLIWHLGLAHPLHDAVGAGLEEHAGTLAEAGFEVIATPGEARLATHELLRTHRAAGLAREEVEGRWARITDRVWEHKGVSLLSTPDLCAADKDQLLLALDPLIGVEVHLVLTVGPWSEQLYGEWLAELASGQETDQRAVQPTDWDTYVRRVSETAGQDKGHRQAEEFWAGHDVASVLARWGWTFHADRLHVVVAADPAAQWTALLDLAGVPGAEDLQAVVPVSVAVPHVDPSPLQPLLERWSESLPAAGHDVRGDLRDLGVQEPGVLAPGPDPAVASLAAVLAENLRLRALVARLGIENERLDRKRRKHKRRLRQLQAASGG